MTTSQITTDASPEDDLEWRAFRYISDEMSVEEREQFETELETDLAACEALARMAVVSLATSQLLRGVTNPAPQREIKTVRASDREEASRPPRWLGLVLAAAALVLVGIQLFSRPVTNSKTQTLVASDQLDEAAELLAQWNLPMGNLPVGNLEDSDGHDDDFATLRIEESSDLESEHSDFPSWMIAALTLEEMPATDSLPETKDN